MRSRSVALSVAFTVVSASAAVACYLKASGYRGQAEWLSVRGNAEASEYATSFNSALADKELATFEERRGLLDRARNWQTAQMLFVLTSVMGLFGSYTLFLLAGLRDQLEEGAAELADPPGQRS